MRSNAREPRVRVPAHGRCPRCKKVRKLWVRANECNEGRVFSRNVPGEGKVCWVCVIRETDPGWRPGKPMPVLPKTEEPPIQAVVEDLLAEFKKVINQIEEPHVIEDVLHWSVLKAISTGEVQTIEEARALATRALEPSNTYYHKCYV